MVKSKKILFLGAASVLAMSTIAALSAETLKTAFGNTEVVWKHYEAVAPTKDAKGIKQYWVNCTDNSHVFEKPSGTGVTIEEGEWNDTKKAEVIALNDDRAIAEGDFQTWLHSAEGFLVGLGVSDVAYDAANDKYTLVAGKNAGTPEEPLSSKTDAAVHFNGKHLKVARACGYRYISFNIQATSRMEGYAADRYAIASADVPGTDSWKLNYSEQNFDLSTPSLFELNLTYYDDVADDVNFSVYFGIRNSASPQLNSIESDVVITDLVATDITRKPVVNTSNATAVATTNDMGLVTSLVINQCKQGTGGGYDHNGLSAGYIAGVKDLGFDKIYCRVKATDIVKNDESKSNLGFVRADGKVGYPGGMLGAWYAFEVNTSVNSELNVGVAHDGGTSNPSTTITLELFYSRLVKDSFTNDQAAAHPWSLNVLSFGITGQNAGAGNVGNANVLSNGADVTLNGVSRETRFYGNALHIMNYTPALNDVIVFKAGTYSDPQNQWNVARSVTLPNDLTFKFVGGTFIEVVD